MDHIIDGVLRFQRDVYPNEAALLRELSLAQKPAVLFIGCADSRVVPEMLTQQGPGDGTLRLVPMINAMSYMLLRAIQDDTPDDDFCGARSRLRSRARGAPAGDDRPCCVYRHRPHRAGHCFGNYSA